MLLSTNVFNSFIIEIMIVVLNGKTASLGHMLIVVAVGRDFAFLGKLFGEVTLRG